MNRILMSHRVLAVLIAAQALVPTARAESDLNYERANVLFQEGRRLMADGRHREACEHFEQALAIEEAIGSKYNLARCWESLGRTASAQALYAEVAAAADSKGQTERARVARERMAALEPRLSRLVIDVEVASSELRIESNRASVAAERWGKPVAVDPGIYEIVATAPGKATWARTVSVGASQSLVWVSIPKLADAPRRDTKDCVNPELASAQPKPLRRSAPERSPVNESVLQTWRPVAIGLAAVGLGGVAAGTVFALKYRSDNREAEGICPDNTACTEDDIDRYQKLTGNARASRTGAYISFGVGAAALIGAGATYFGIPLYRQEGAVRVSAEPVYGLDGSWGVSASGRF